MLRRNMTHANQQGLSMQHLLCIALAVLLPNGLADGPLLAGDALARINSPMTAEQVRKIQSAWARHSADRSLKRIPSG